VIHLSLVYEELSTMFALFISKWLCVTPRIFFPPPGTDSDYGRRRFFPETGGDLFPQRFLPGLLPSPIQPKWRVPNFSVCANTLVHLANDAQGRLLLFQSLIAPFLLVEESRCWRLTPNFPVISLVMSWLSGVQRGDFFLLEVLLQAPLGLDFFRIFSPTPRRCISSSGFPLLNTGKPPLPSPPNPAHVTIPPSFCFVLYPHMLLTLSSRPPSFFLYFLSWHPSGPWSRTHFECFFCCVFFWRYDDEVFVVYVLLFGRDIFFSLFLVFPFFFFFVFSPLPN